MLHLSEASVARFTEQILGTEPDSRIWKVEHATSGSYPAEQVGDPVTWFVRNYGLIPTSIGPRAASVAVGPGLSSLSALLPVASCSADWSNRLGLPSSGDGLSEAHWAEAIAAAETSTVLGAAKVYALACRFIPAPAQIRCLVRGGEEVRPPDSVFVTTRLSELGVASDTDSPILCVASDAEARALIDAWGLRTYEGLVETVVDAVPKGDPILVVEAFPDLRPYLHRRDAQTELVRCAELRLASVGPGGRRTVDVELVREDGRFYWLDAAGDDRSLIGRLSDELGLGLKAADVDEILDGRDRVDARTLLAALRAESEPASKLVLAIGRGAIERHLSSQLIEAVEEIQGPLDDLGVAKLAASQFGIDLFREFKLELLQKGLNPPERWSGSPNARRFVQSLGLPRPFAGYEEARLDPLYEVEGPANLGPLHDFQQVLTKRIRALLTAPEGRRALLWLPTGAGKTRVTVQALIRAVKKDGLVGPILWIAPTQELCEQAVQTWAYVWRSVGPRSKLTISRLWDDKEAEEGPDDGLQVVVATDAKLGIVVGKADYQWLSLASVVIVDEAHGSTETGYTKILHWLGLGREQTRDRCPLIGLTATPFKGTSVEATERLARRYGSRLLSEGVLGDDPYTTLQEMQVLARAKQRVLSGSTIELTERQAATAHEQNRLPPEVEERLGQDKSRNESILKTILELDPTWKILVFAASVAHAHQLAAILSLRGVRAAAISSKTNPAARRHYIRDFNAGDLRVLTNYGVLAEGFDAPSVRAVIVARPTLSPGVYQQMIGRGLRGPLNGGKDECLIVNVQDNILRFGGELAFHHFNYLFDG
jgi:superfamily II DNA or RNA helicase